MELVMGQCVLERSWQRMVQFTYYGHACFLLDDGKYKVLCDPFLTGNPKATVKLEDVEADFILITHAHSDHLGDAPEIAAFGKVRMTLAQHSSGVPGGIACGYVIYMGGLKIYFAGDTALFSDMQLIGKKDDLDYAILPVGDNYTMGLEDAAMAAQLLNARHIIPVHYNTWPIINQDVRHYKEITEAMTRAEVHIVEPGGTWEMQA